MRRLHADSPATTTWEADFLLRKRLSRGKSRENGRAVYRFGRERAFGGSVGVGGVGGRGPGRVPVVGCLHHPSAEVAGIRASSGRVVLRCVRRVFTQPRRLQCCTLQHWLNGASLRCVCSCPLTELPCVLLRRHILCLAGWVPCTRAFV
jgi:hypothetical protein